MRTVLRSFTSVLCLCLSGIAGHAPASDAPHQGNPLGPSPSPHPTVTATDPQQPRPQRLPATTAQQRNSVTTHALPTRIEPRGARPSAASATTSSAPSPALPHTRSRPISGDHELNPVPLPARETGRPAPDLPPQVPQQTASSDVRPFAAGRRRPQALEPQPPAPAKAARQEAIPREVAQFAEQQIAEGYQLAMRGATHSARLRFTRALEIVADALDMTEGRSVHRNALWDAMTAIQEAKDFLPLRSQRQHAPVGRVIEVHKTIVLKSRADVDDLAAMEALQRYFTYAAKQLHIAGGSAPVASHALYQLGKLTPLIEKNSLMTPTAYAYFQAALEVDQQNYLAANELGVLLANMGYLDASQATLRHSLSVYPSREVWHNLSVVHQRKGEHALAAQAQREGEQLAIAKGRTSPHQVNPIVWLPNKEFARVGQPGHQSPHETQRR